MTKRFGIVYQATCRDSGKSYIGITTTSLRKRWWTHVKTALAKRGACRAIASAIRKYGADAFHVEEIASCLSKDALLAAEREIIADRGTLSPAGYNLTTGGDHPNLSKATRARIGRAKRGKSWGNHTEESRALMADGIKKGIETRGYRYTDEYRKRMGRKRRGKRQSAEIQAKRSAALKAFHETEAGKLNTKAALDARYSNHQYSFRFHKTDRRRGVVRPRLPGTRLVH